MNVTNACRVLADEATYSSLELEQRAMERRSVRSFPNPCTAASCNLQDTGSQISSPLLDFLRSCFGHGVVRVAYVGWINGLACLSPPLPDFHAAELAALPAVLLIATQDDTVFYGYGWNRLVALTSNVETIRLNKGDMLMLRGDFCYATAGYGSKNLLLHAYLDMPQYQRELEGNDPHLVAVVDDIAVPDDSPFCYVHNCPFVATSTTSLRKHMNRFHSFFFGCSRH